ncbi:MAG: DUF1553 domain-containing protein, partial [Prosthecobacter sp.]
YPFLSTFDVPNGESSCIRRSRSNTPMQALMTLNETMSMEAAQALAARMEKEGGIAFGFRLCTNREPTKKELQALEALAKRQSTRKDAIPPMVAVARVLLNLDETITKE